jgi:hypothetical protein
MLKPVGLVSALVPLPPSLEVEGGLGVPTVISHCPEPVLHGQEYQNK